MAKAAESRTAVTFADKAYKSRTIVLPDGRSFAVDKGRITASDPALVAHLDKRPEFERVGGELAGNES